MIRYILFDVDDTLYPRSSSLFPMLRDRIIQYMVDQLRMTRSEAEGLRERYLKEYGTATRGLHLNNQINLHDFLTYVHDLPVSQVLFRDPELSWVLSQIPIEKCMFTNATRQHAINVADALGIRHHFTHIFALEDFDFISKPDPHPYKVVLRRLNARGEECILLEDSARNLLTAREFGMVTVLVDGRNVDVQLFDFTISRVHEILDVARKVGVLA